MDTLAEIVRQPGLPSHGRVFTRRAVRAIIADGARLLLIYSTVNGDYKFPGGGVKRGESDGMALRRELREETGVLSVQIVGDFGQVIETDAAREPGFSLFRMSSVYYFCQVGPERCPPAYDTYELALGFQPTWTELGAAIETNTALLSSAGSDIPRWTQRETLVMSLLEARWKGEK